MLVRLRIPRLKPSQILILLTSNIYVNPNMIEVIATRFVD